MVKVNVLRSFRDKYSDVVYEKGDSVEFSPERVTELLNNLSVHNDTFFEVVETADNAGEDLDVETVDNTEEEKVDKSGKKPRGRKKQEAE